MGVSEIVGVASLNADLSRFLCQSPRDTRSSPPHNPKLARNALNLSDDTLDDLLRQTYLYSKRG